MKSRRRPLFWLLAALVLLAWLRHIASNLGKSDTYAESPLWVHRAILPVLRQLAHG